MVILHLAFVKNNYASGVRVVVPQIVQSQQCIENVALYNFGAVTLNKSERIHLLSEEGSLDLKIKALPKPFNHPDIVIFHNIYSIHYIKVAKELKKRQIPYIIIPHSSLTRQALESKRLKKKIAHKLWFDNFVNGAAAIQYLTEVEKDNSPFSVPSIIIPNGIQVREYSYRKRKEKNTVNMVFVGRKNIHQKGLDVLLSACKLISKQLQDHNVEIQLFGPDDHGGSQKIDQLIEKYNLKDVVFNLNALYDKEKKRVLQSADVFLLPSRFEGHSVGLLEAMAEGLPVLVTPGTGNVYEVSKNKCGWTSEFNEYSLSKTLLQIINEKEKYTEYSKNSYDYVNKVYSWENISEKAVTEYSNIIQK